MEKMITDKAFAEAKLKEFGDALGPARKEATEESLWAGDGQAVVLAIIASIVLHVSTSFEF
jgi:hypothetical protein